MTFVELEQSLPNGLHDARLFGLSVDYVNQVAILDLNIDISSEKDIEVRRRGRVVFGGLLFIVVDAPSVENGFVGVSMIDAGSGHPDTDPPRLPHIPENCFLCWVFVFNWNSFVRIAARVASVEWAEP
jgi:hypothetical protein